MIPAHVTRTSSEPPRSTAAATAASTSERLVTSQRTPTPPIASAVSRAPASSKSATTTVAPSDAKRLAVAAPIPRAPPVTSTVFPSKRIAASLYGRVVEFRDILAQRRMHRSFTGEPVDPASVGRIARTIRHAPSGGFSQGQSIVVVTERSTRAAIAQAFGDEHYSTGGRNFIADAPVHMVVSANEAHYHARYTEPDKLAATGGVEVTWPVPYWFVDAGAVMMLVLLAAIDEGLAGAFVGHPDQKRIFDALLGLPPDVVPIGLALIGHPSPVGATPGSRLASRRRPLDDQVHRERW